MNKKTLIVSLILMAVLTSSFVGAVLARPFYKDISVVKAQRMVFSKGHHDLVVIDLRPNSMFMSGHIPGAINVPVLIAPPFPPEFDWTVLEDWILSGEGQSHLNHKIIIHCLKGLASPTGAQMLVDEGFKKVYNMEGGFTAWIDAGYPTE